MEAALLCADLRLLCGGPTAIGVVDWWLEPVWFGSGDDDQKLVVGDTSYRLVTGGTWQRD